MNNKEKRLKEEIKAWKETASILSNQKIMSSIDRSLKEIARGKSIPASKL